MPMMLYSTKNINSLRCLLTGPASSNFFFFNDTATTEIYTLSLHDALPICQRHDLLDRPLELADHQRGQDRRREIHRSEEHTSELQSRLHLVCRLLLEKKKKHTVEIHQHLHYRQQDLATRRDLSC